ncbi:MAG: ornithine carbamoyltransferase [Solirubrobacterales bacterium]|jgi:ornithine carbamoyltransferase|nr:ornithine carbamoyltransferase [Solirubrobacterales bacterium]
MSLTETRPSNLLRIADLSAGELAEPLALGQRMSASPHGWGDRFRGETLVCLFEKPSTRTRVSFAAAAARLGMFPLMLPDDELQLGRGEPIADTAKGAASFVVATGGIAAIGALADAGALLSGDAGTTVHPQPSANYGRTTRSRPDGVTPAR